MKNIILGHVLSSPLWAGGSAVSYVFVVISCALPFSDPSGGPAAHSHKAVTKCEFNFSKGIRNFVINDVHAVDLLCARHRKVTLISAPEI